MKTRLLKLSLLIVFGLIAFTAGKIVAKYFNVKAQKPQIERYGSIVRFVQEGHTYCSGTVVASNLIITAAHCVLEETPFGYMRRDSIEIRPANNTNTRTIGTVIYATPQMDQALVLGDFKAFDARRMITDPEQLSNLRLKKTKFISCGFPLNGDLYCNETIFDKTSDFFWVVNGVLIPGMSGGPTFLPDGTMVGVNVAVHGDKSVVSPIYNITKNIGGR